MESALKVICHVVILESVKNIDNKNNNKFLFILCGESGCGKTTMAELLEKYHGLKNLQSYTDRKPRYEGETGHIFVSKSEFDKLTNLIAYTEFCGNRYCGTAEQVEENDIYILDKDGIKYLINHYHGNKIIKVIYIKVDEKSRIYRMLRRKDSHEDATKRINNDRVAFTEIEKMADFIIENKYKFTCMDDIYAYMKKCWKGSE